MYLYDSVESSWKRGDISIPIGGGSPFISSKADLDSLFWNPNQTEFDPVNINDSSFQEITTPSGPGFEVNCSDANETNWSPAVRAVLARKNGTTALGETHDWTWNMYLPTQSFVGGNPAGLFWQYHAEGDSSGHHLAVNLDNTYRIGRQSAAGQNYERNWSDGPPITFDAWIPFRLQVKWSLAGDGFLRIWIDNTQVLDFSGATQFAGDGQPYLQFGWYAERPSSVTNTARFGNIRRTVS